MGLEADPESCLTLFLVALYEQVLLGARHWGILWPTLVKFPGVVTDEPGLRAYGRAEWPCVTHF